MLFATVILDPSSVMLVVYNLFHLEPLEPKSLVPLGYKFSHVKPDELINKTGVVSYLTTNLSAKISSSIVSVCGSDGDDIVNNSVVTSPDILAVIVPAEKLPDPSRKTKLLVPDDEAP
eukprot:Lithocolla_globosa_v1_NODE_5855_length_1174_cov_908.992851.p1 type:complete len:118 gc:universal NODE_5855_length_1174_cov_908.992851:608-255(-)